MLKAAHCRPRSHEDNHFNQIVVCNLKEEDPNSGEQERPFKEGICWFELQHTHMAQWSIRRAASGRRENSTNNHQFSSIDMQKEEDGEDVTADSLVSEEDTKRGLPLEEARPKRQRRQMQSDILKPKRKNHDNLVRRWSAERYKQAEQCLLEILREEGAVFGKPLTRAQLRIAGRKHIGDTGLLDHLLKHINGKVAPGGAERFRRGHNPTGVMEYWLENPELDDIRREAGVENPYWLPASGALEEPASSSDMKLIKEDILNLKRELAELAAERKDQDEANLVERMYTEYKSSLTNMDQRLIEISSSVSGLQDMYRDLSASQVKIEQELMEISNSWSSLQAAKTCTHPLGHPNSEQWKDWLESTNLEDDIQGDEITNWLANTDSVNFERNVDPYSSLPTRLKPGDETVPQGAAHELALLKEEVAMVKREMKELSLKKQNDSLPNWNQYASLNVNPQLDFKSQLLLFQQQIRKELVEWKSKVEQQMKEALNTVRSVQQATRQLTARSPSPAFYL